LLLPSSRPERTKNSRRQLHGRVLQSQRRGAAPYRGERVEGVEILVNDRNALDAPELGVEAVSALEALSGNFQVDKVDRLLLNHNVLDQIKAGDDPRKISADWQASVAEFRVQRAEYLLCK
jgi:hypothetical protein